MIGLGQSLCSIGPVEESGEAAIGSDQEGGNCHLCQTSCNCFATVQVFFIFANIKEGKVKYWWGGLKYPSLKV